MRYYDIQIFKPGSTTIYKEYTSYPKVGASYQNDPGALNVLLDAYVVPFATPAQQSIIQIWGISLADISQASNFTGYTINVYAGFQKGLPLNNPAQAGLILTGTIYQSFANWQGTDMTLDFVVVTNGSVAAQDNNISFNWLAGSSLASALSTTLSTAFPGVTQNIQIDPRLVLAHDEHGAYSSLPAFCQMLKPVTQEIIGGSYAGVDIVLTGTSITVFDGSTQSAPKQIAFQDLLGQPTWIGPATIQFVCPLRADLAVADYVTLPKGILGNPSNPYGSPGAVVTTSAAVPSTRQQSAFSGVFFIAEVHHMGNFRQPDGASWITVFNANSVPNATSAAAGAAP